MSRAVRVRVRVGVVRCCGLSVVAADRTSAPLGGLLACLLASSSEQPSTPLFLRPISWHGRASRHGPQRPLLHGVVARAEPAASILHPALNRPRAISIDTSCERDPTWHYDSITARCLVLISPRLISRPRHLIDHERGLVTYAQLVRHPRLALHIRPAGSTLRCCQDHPPSISSTITRSGDFAEKAHSTEHRLCSQQ